jgi:hypothetical protein
MKIAIDISYYQEILPEQWDLLATVLDGVIIRLCFGTSMDGKAARHIDQVKRLGLPYAGYGWVDPTKPINSQVDTFLKAIEVHQPAGMFNDYEQYWTDWAAYMSGDYAKAYATRFSPSQIDSYYRKFDNLMTTKSPVKVGRYSADWFINGYCNSMATWVKQVNYWEAKYMRWFDKNYLRTKKVLWGVPFDIVNIKELAEYCSKDHKGIGRQFDSFLEVKGLFPGMRYHLDWNVFTNIGFATMFGTMPIEEEKPSDPDVISLTPFRVEAWACNVRSDSNSNSKIIGWRVRGNTVMVSDIEDGWANILPVGWINAKLLKRL